MHIKRFLLLLLPTLFLFYNMLEISPWDSLYHQSWSKSFGQDWFSTKDIFLFKVIPPLCRSSFGKYPCGEPRTTNDEYAKKPNWNSGRELLCWSNAPDRMKFADRSTTDLRLNTHPLSIYFSCLLYVLDAENQSPMQHKKKKE